MMMRRCAYHAMAVAALLVSGTLSICAEPSSKEEGGQATCTNPIVPGDWSDPGVIRVGEDYYSVCSTNNWQPGIPIIHSKDLVHWRYIGHAFRSNPSLLAAGR